MCKHIRWCHYIPEVAQLGRSSCDLTDIANNCHVRCFTTSRSQQVTSLHFTKRVNTQYSLSVVPLFIYLFFYKNNLLVKKKKPQNVLLRLSDNLHTSYSSFTRRQRQSTDCSALHTPSTVTASTPSLLLCGSRDHFPGALPRASLRLLGLSGMDA